MRSIGTRHCTTQSPSTFGTSPITFVVVTPCSPSPEACRQDGPIQSLCRRCFEPLSDVDPASSRCRLTVTRAQVGNNRNSHLAYPTVDSHANLPAPEAMCTRRSNRDNHRNHATWKSNILGSSAKAALLSPGKLQIPNLHNRKASMERPRRILEPIMVVLNFGVTIRSLLLPSDVVSARIDILDEPNPRCHLSSLCQNSPSNLFNHFPVDKKDTFLVN
ncbi:hypothetical protein BGZ61DRAFT_212677 [Ilyonectria robusta]|uniref:uncharacterized protein n=1 Tax=Ilyonectria robusta TaxID=1079257 RepID=UPI001E8E73AC|nr:uncharacterized protein BGZ61DRAFT_212677 [Ilyonectria robusta]KAH8714532.1 hypothetical protein BGZ61DRAFT_212677 [Ilyonectria robusta]